MTDKKEMVVKKRGFLEPGNYSQVVEFANMAAKTALIPASFRGKPYDILIAIQMGAEVGLSPMQALQSIAVINGRAALWGDACLAIVSTHPDFIDCFETLDEKTKTAKCVVNRRGREPIERTFSWEDATTAGLTKKAGPWKEYPKRMLRMRARSFALRDSFPDVLKGIRVAEEQQDVLPETPDAPQTIDDIVEGVVSVRTEKQETKQDELWGIKNDETTKSTMDSTEQTETMDSDAKPDAA